MPPIQRKRRHQGLVFKPYSRATQQTTSTYAGFEAIVSDTSDTAENSVTSPDISEKSTQPNDAADTEINLISAPTPTRTTIIKTKFLILSDTHGESELPISPNTPIDVVLHCGDLSECGTLDEYRKTLSLLSSISAPLKLIIPGNHDLTLDKKFWDENSTASGRDLYERAREIFTGTEAKQAGVTYLENGIHEFRLENGAMLRIYVNSATPRDSQSVDWAFGYPSSHDIYNPPGLGISYSQAAGNEMTEMREGEMIDVLMTHGPARYRLDKTFEGDSIGCPHLFRALRRVRPRMHVFGHVHSGHGVETVRWNENKDLPEDDDDDDGIEKVLRVGAREESGVMRVEGGGERGETMVVNAAMMGFDQELGRERLTRKPWLVELALGLGWC